MPPVTITQLQSLLVGDGLKRDYIPATQIAGSVKLAAIASEDQLFPDHAGFDWGAIEQSLTVSTRHNKKRIRGAAASTISQQTAKNVFLWQGRGWTRYLRKIPEAFYTQLIEWVWGKERILEVYLNTIEMGRGVYGIEAAANCYFRKPASKLSNTEAAKIIACLPNPKLFTVVPMSKRVAWRYPQILKQMSNLAADPQVIKLVH